MKQIVLACGVAVLEGDSHLGKWVQEHGRLDCDPAAALAADFIRPGTSVVDVGASIGDHTVTYLRRAARVWAFEPNPDAFNCLRHNCPAAKSFNVALGSKPGLLYWVPVAPNYGASHLSREPQQGALQVPVWRLDDLKVGLPVSLIKIDVEGWEIEVLRGARQTIQRDRPVLLVEVSGHLRRVGASSTELLDLIVGLGYSVESALDGPRNEQWDALCSPR